MGGLLGKSNPLQTIIGWTSYRRDGFYAGSLWFINSSNKKLNNILVIMLLKLVDTCVNTQYKNILVCRYNHIKFNNGIRYPKVL